MQPRLSLSLFYAEPSLFMVNDNGNGHNGKQTVYFESLQSSVYSVSMQIISVPVLIDSLLEAL